MEIRALVSALAPGDIAVDVGANKGAYLPSLSRAVPGGTVVAFEPQPSLAVYLRRACAAADLRNVVVEGVGVSERDGMLRLAVPGDGESSQDASFELGSVGEGPVRFHEVTVRSLDSYFAKETRRVAALKIDVEGHELAVLRGAAGLLEGHAPLVVCEIESRHQAAGTVFDVLEQFRSLGFDGHFVRRARLVPISEFEPAVHQSTRGDRFWDNPGYCNNFVLRKST